MPAELVDFMLLAGKTAAGLNQKLYLVGGVVRDLVLERPNQDLDLVAEGDAIKLAGELAGIVNGRVIAHSRFNTAKIRWDRWSVDIAAARSEGYSRPGALPHVKPSDINSDLIRRDFTINAMAVYLEPSRFGELIDLYRGREDLDKKVVRILHENSFKDDATRLWRAIRYEKRLGFHIEPFTLEIFRRDIDYLGVVSGDRIRHELELCLKEERPEKALFRAGELGLLAKICPSLKAERWLTGKIARARGMLQPYTPPEHINLAFLVYHLEPQELADLSAYLKLPRAIARNLEDTLALKAELKHLEEPELSPGRIYSCLHVHSQAAILTNLLAVDSKIVRRHIELYLSRLRHVRPSLNGNDLAKAGLASGPRISQMLELLREARLDGRVNNREEELELVKKLV